MENERIKAIVVDDEINTRKLLQVIVDWKEYGIEFVGEAGNGNEALDVIEAVRPNIVFTDINMPYMDGLELAELVRERDPFIKVVVLTAYPEFDYAKQSVKLGVHDFLVKPIQPDVLQKMLAELVEAIRKEAAHWAEYRQIKTTLLENTRELKEKYIMDLLAGTFLDREQIIRRFDYFFAGPLPSSCAVAVLDIETEDQQDVERRMGLCMGCLEAVEFLVQDREGIHVQQDNSGRVVIVGLERSSELESVGEQAIRVIREKLNCKVSVGIGGAWDSFVLLKNSYKEALEALRYGRLVGGNQVISFRDDIRSVHAAANKGNTELEDIIFYIKTGFTRQAVQGMDRLLHSMGASDGTVTEQAYSMSTQFISLLITTLSEWNFARMRSLLLNSALFNRLFACQTVGELSLFLTKLVEEAAEDVHGTRMKKTNRVVNEVLAYLAEEFRNPEVTLATVSEKLHVNSSYLSRIFKQEVGQSFTDYLLKLRIDEAVKLVNETNWKAYQIAEKVGIRDPYYFSHRFKKVTGVSIQEFKRASLE